MSYSLLRRAKASASSWASAISASSARRRFSIAISGSNTRVSSSMMESSPSMSACWVRKPIRASLAMEISPPSDGISPLMIFSSVVLPLPFTPTRPSLSPSCSASVASRITSLVPNALRTALKDNSTISSSRNSVNAKSRPGMPPKLGANSKSYPLLYQMFG